MGEKWSRERAWAWYDAHPWFRGCNFMGSDCANRIDQWQEYGFEERLKTADDELRLAAETGFNTIRIILEFFVWQKDPDGFMQRFDRYLETAHKHGISAMVVLGNDCMQPKEFTKPFKLGPQHYDWGYHGGRKRSQHSVFNAMGYHLLDEPELALQHYEWVRAVISAHKDDERIVFWDLYNEPGNSHREGVTLPHLKKFFEIAREIDPIQPLTCAAWRCPADRNEPIPALEAFALENSDIISYHNYGSFETNIQIIKRLKDEYGRPIVNTEWLARCLNNNVWDLYPLFYLEKIGCYNWGFVAGKYQTYEPWEGLWQRYEKNPDADIDFTKWFHDLYRPSHHPYDPKEIALIKKFGALADADFKRKNS